MKNKIEEIHMKRETGKLMKRKACRIFIKYAAVTAFTLLFGIIYERYSHGVYSPFMALMFLIPLIGGVLPFGVMYLNGRPRFPDSFSRTLLGCGIATLTVGSAYQGVLDIYGTTSHLADVYLIAGCILTAAAVLVYFKKNRPVFTR